MMLPSLLPLSLLATTVCALETTLASSLNTITRSNSTISAAWYTGWHAKDFPLSQISWSKYTHLTYAFAITTPDVNTLSLDVSDEQLLPQFVSLARQHQVKSSISIGGWTGSRWFSQNVNTAKNRTAFVNTVTNLANKYTLDGIDFDWEFPGIQGIGCNEVDPQDTNNFLAFLQELRTTSTGQNLILSASVFDTPWVDATGSPSTNIAAFSSVLDYITIMNYDVKSNPAIGAGPSSPLDYSCAPGGARIGSAISAVQTWSAAGMPVKQIVLGVPAYGHSFVLTSNPEPSSGSSQNVTLSSYPKYNASLEKRGDSWDGTGGLDVCGVMQGPGGVFTYWGLMQQGFLEQDGSVADGIKYQFDNCSQTPYLYNTSTGVYVSYENALSFAIKGGYIHSSGLKGFAIWEAGGDSNDTLLDSILNATQYGGPSLTSKAGPNTPAASSAASSSAASSIVLEGAQSMWRYFLVALLGLRPWLV